MPFGEEFSAHDATSLNYNVTVSKIVKEENLPWSEKYRPKFLDEFESHGFIATSLTKMIEASNLPHLLFYGPPGTGKTSAILAVTNKIYKPGERGSMILEMNASDDRGINTVRNEILSFSSSKTLFGTKHKLLILDEADSMTNEAQNALRRIIEKYTKNVRFCLICNYLSGIIPAIQSRCTRFRFFPLAEPAMRCRLLNIIQSEHVQYNNRGIDSIIRVSDGDMRKALNILQTTYMSHGYINSKNVKLSTGYPSVKDIKKLLELLFNCDIKHCFDHLYKCSVVQGITITDIIKELFLELKKISLPSQVMSHIIKSMAEVDYNCSTGTNIKIHISALVSCFYNARVEMEKKEIMK